MVNFSANLFSCGAIQAAARFLLLLIGAAAVGMTHAQDMADDYQTDAYGNEIVAPTMTKETITEEREVIIPLSEKVTKTPAAVPMRGQSTSKIKALFGEPKKAHKATGKPPISRWDYDEFTVYFESGFVIHTVIKHTP